MPGVKDFFQAGFSTTCAGGYFNSIELLNHYIHYHHPTLTKVVAKELKLVKEEAESITQEITQIHAVADEMKIIMVAPPAFPEAYFSWARMTFSGFTETLDDLDPKKIAFNIGYYSGQILSSLKLLKVILNISTAVVGIPAFQEQWSNTSKSILKSIKNLEAASNLAVLTPKGPEELSERYAKQFCVAGREIAEAEIDFSNQAYLFLLSSKVENHQKDLIVKNEETNIYLKN
ncbi:MAG: hypothetical protein KTR26_10725 [Flammeovirgaceae bacterium]|nr:hypothetical protein [Flammeovirgaceae bacterium]